MATPLVKGGDQIDRSEMENDRVYKMSRRKISEEAEEALHTPGKSSEGSHVCMGPY